MITLKEAISIAYKSSAVAYAAANTKERIARERRDSIKAAMKLIGDRNTAYFRRLEKRHTLWFNYYTAQGYAKKFFTYENDGPIRGVKPYLEDLWVKMGFLLSELPDWDKYADRELKTVAAFSRMSKARRRRIDEAEENFAGNAHEITTTDFESQFEEMLDLFVNDIWAAEGMRIWTKEQLDRTAELPEHLEMWDHVSDSAGEFFQNASTRCCVKLANHFHQYQNDDAANEDNCKIKYRYKNSNRYRAIQGLFALDTESLPAGDKSRREHKRVRYR